MPWVFDNLELGYISYDLRGRLKPIQGGQVKHGRLILSTEQALDDFLHQVYYLITHQDCMDKTLEHVMLWSLSGVPIRKVPRLMARAIGIPLETVRLMVLTPDKKIILSQRSYAKKIEPGKWEHLVGGVIAADELPKDCFLREAYEEAGLSIEQLQKLEYLGSYTFTDVDKQEQCVIRDLHHVGLVREIALQAIYNTDLSIHSFKEYTVKELQENFVRSPSLYLQDFGFTLPFLQRVV